jgi:hypothetical protein
LPRDYCTITTIITLPTNDDEPLKLSAGKLVEDCLNNTAPSRLHQCQIWNGTPLHRQLIDPPHLLSHQNLHK